MPKDAAKAVEWYQKAAMQGNSISQRYLGGMYFYGEGVSRNFVLAYAWLNLSAAQGDDYSKETRDELEKRLTPVERAEGQRKASEWNKGELIN